MTLRPTFALTLLGAALLGWWRAQPPRPLPINSPSAEFSAERASADLRRIAREPHATGTPEIAALRGYLATRLVALGFAVREMPFPLSERQSARLGRRGGVPTTTGVNLVAVRRGADSGAPAVAIMAHYDGVWGSPAAADDGFGLASALEVARALPRSLQQRDLVLLFTDAEEIGLSGAAAFFAPPPAGDPLADRIGALVNLEARGGGGRAIMFQTSRRNGALIALYQREVRDPAANSLTVTIYERLPNSTDFTTTAARAIPGFNIAPIGDARLYHSPLATADAVDLGTLQHMGSQSLDLVRALLTAPALPSATDDLVFSDLLGWTTIAYAPRTGWLLLVGAAAVLVAIAWRQREAWRGTQLISSAGTSLGAVLLAGVLLLLGNQLSIGAAGREYYDRLAALPRLELMVLLVLLAVLIAVAAIRSGSPMARVLGALLATLVVAALTQAMLPGAALLFAWPLFAAVAALALREWLGGARSRVGLLAAVAAAIASLAWLGGFAHFALLAIGADLPSAVAPLLLPALAVLAVLMPELSPRTALRSAGALLLAAAVLALWVRVDAVAPSVPVYDERR